MCKKVEEKYNGRKRTTELGSDRQSFVGVALVMVHDVVNMKMGSNNIICLLPEKTMYGRATSQLITDIEAYCRELGFSVKYSRSLTYGILQSILGRYKLYITLYPGLFNPIVRSSVQFVVKLVIGLVLLFLRFLGKKIIFYVYDLPIEQNVFVWGKILREKQSRAIEALYLRVASSLLVFNELTLRYLSTQYKLPKHKFECFEILDYGFDISPPEKNAVVPKTKIRIVYSAGFNNPKVRWKVVEFLLSCPELANIEFLLVGRDSDLVEVVKYNVRKLSEVEQRYLPVIYGSCDFGLVLKASAYYEFGATSKFSSYLHSGLPVLVPENYFYLTSVVRRYGVGIVFKDCKDLVAKLSSLTPQQYSLLIYNVRLLGYRIKHGYFFKKSLLKTLERVV